MSYSSISMFQSGLQMLSTTRRDRIKGNKLGMQNMLIPNWLTGFVCKIGVLYMELSVLISIVILYNK